jgi:hypothetical protein
MKNTKIALSALILAGFISSFCSCSSQSMVSREIVYDGGHGYIYKAEHFSKRINYPQLNSDSTKDIRNPNLR